MSDRLRRRQGEPRASEATGGFQNSARYSRVVVLFTPTGTHPTLAQLVFLIAALLVPAVMLVRYWITRK